MRTSRAMRAASPVTEPMSRSATVTRAAVLDRRPRAAGRSAWSAAPTTVPTSASVSVTVFSVVIEDRAMRVERGAAEQAAERGPADDSEIVDAMIGRAASRSA